MHKRIGVLMYQTSNSKGQELVAQRMVRDLVSLGHDVYLITSVYHDGVEVISSDSLMEGKGYVLVKDAELEIPVIRVASYVIKWPRRRISFRDFVHVLERIVDEFKLNVLVTHSTLWNGPEEVAKFVAWRHYMKDFGGYVDPIVFCHMSHFQEPSARHYSLVERTFRMAWNRLSLSQILKTANLVLVVTPEEKETKLKMGADPKKCFLFSSGVNEEPFLRYAASDTKDFARRHDISEGARIVSYLGSLEERKNPMAVLKIAKLFKGRSDIHFIIAGRGETRYAKRVREEASQLPNVTYLGEIDEKEKILLVKSSFINILMSKVEALGLTQMEFMYMGIPVITSGVGGQSWLIRDGKEGIHVQGPEDIDGAAEAIRSLIDNPEKWNRLSVNAKEKARSMTSYKIIRELDDAITEQMVRESGWGHIPQETLMTLSEPERVLKTWSKGNWGVVATDRRLFVRHGYITRKITEMRYENIINIEHTRRYPWKFLATGLLLPTSALLLDSMYVNRESIFTRGILDFIKTLVAPPRALIPPFVSADILTILVATITCLAGLMAFLLEARTGFNLQEPGARSVYLPHGFRDVITFIRNVQDKGQDVLQLESVETKLEDSSRRNDARTA